MSKQIKQQSKVKVCISAKKNPTTADDCTEEEEEDNIII